MRFVILTVFSGLLAANAQQSTAADVFYGLDAGKLCPLERQVAIARGKAGGFIAIKMKGTLEVTGGKSPVRFRSGVPLEFIIRPAADPLTSYCFRRLDSKRKIREIVITSGHASPLGASTTINASQGVMPITVSLYSPNVYKMTAKNLRPGEYALSRTSGGLMFCFGVDQ